MASSQLKGKICLVTGGNSGLGFVTARELARMGATVAIVCRDRARGEAALAALTTASGGGALELLIADLSSQDSIRELARDFKQRHDRLHVLVNNAGAANGNRELTVDGHERTFATNHLGYFLLTELLLDLLRASAPARVVNVASQMQAMGSLRFEDLMTERNYSWGRAYSQSKLANVVFTYELARRLEGTGVTANCVHPGAVGTNFGSNTGLFFRNLVQVGRPFLLSPERGAQTLIWLASSPEVEGVTGKYFERKKEIRSQPASYDPALAKRLWEVSEQLTRGGSLSGRGPGGLAGG
jgi:retinol dehydrogenase 14